MPVAHGERQHGGVRADGVPHPVDEERDAGAPGPGGQGRRGAVDGAEDAFDDEGFQFPSVLDVAVQGHGADAEFDGDGTHGQSGQTLTVDHGEGRGGQSVRGE